MHNTRVSDIDIIFPLICVLFSFNAYYFLSESKRIKEWFTGRYGIENSSVLWIVFQRLSGVLFFGLIPFIGGVLLLKKTSFDVWNTRFFFQSLFWTLGISPLLIAMNYFNANSEDNLNQYPQIRIKIWSIYTLLLSAISWMAYLFAYEFLFRGILLFPVYKSLGYWPAIALNICIYSLVHIPKGIKEALGAIPLGLFLCMITIKTGNIWAPVFLHIVLALSNEWFSLRFHPKINFVWKSKNP